MERLGEKTREQIAARQRPGHEFGKYVYCLAKHRGNLGAAAQEAERFQLSSSFVAPVLKAAIAAGTTSDAGWATELAYYRGLTGDFIENVSRQTILGRLPFVRVPFLTKTIVVTGPLSAAWVAPGDPIPLNRGTFSAPAALSEKKVGVIVPFTDELFELWSSAVQSNVLDLIERAVIWGSDYSLLDPSITATSARPASLTSGIAAGPSTGSTAAQATADLKAMLQSLIDGGSDLSRVVIVMSPSSALHLSQLLTTGGVPAFGQLTATGGFIWGVPVLVTNAAAQVGSPTTHLIVAIDGAKVLVADNGLVMADTARVGSLQFTDAPAAGPTTTVSLFQTNTRAVRLLRYLNFERAHDSAVSWFAVSY